MIDLPDYPGPVGAQVSFLDFGGILTPPLGGPLQKIVRLGTRSKIKVTMPPMRNDSTGRRWLSKLKQGKLGGARMAFPLLGFYPGAPGTVVVDGAAQAGSTLNVRGATPNYAFREDQPFSILSGGIHHLHWVTEESVADDTGAAVLSIVPPLRVQPADGDTCEFVEPMVEGFILGDELLWELALGDFVGVSFEIEESE